MTYVAGSHALAVGVAGSHISAVAVAASHISVVDVTGYRLPLSPLQSQMLRPRP